MGWNEPEKILDMLKEARDYRPPYLWTETKWSLEMSPPRRDEKVSDAIESRTNAIFREQLMNRKVQPQLGPGGDNEFQQWVNSIQEEYASAVSNEERPEQVASSNSYTDNTNNPLLQGYQNQQWFDQWAASKMEALRQKEAQQNVPDTDTKEVSGIDSDITNWQGEGQFWRMKVIKEARITYRSMVMSGQTVEQMLTRMEFLPPEKGSIVLMAVNRDSQVIIYQQVIPVDDSGVPISLRDKSGQPLESPLRRALELEQ